jgi:hypothetical protein
LENGKSLREIAQIMVIKMGRTSLLNKVMDMDDELLEMMTVETKQTTISDFFQPVFFIMRKISHYNLHVQLLRILKNIMFPALATWRPSS